mmetsp:Transcript_96488/g.191171  ORF Transcript_96488/g.191171 Transcript_96488/m.191171 type:complete len:213 (+) Transcript_96488:1843-2481(+)
MHHFHCALKLFTLHVNLLAQRSHPVLTFLHFFASCIAFFLHLHNIARICFDVTLKFFEYLIHLESFSASSVNLAPHFFVFMQKLIEFLDGFVQTMLKVFHRWPCLSDTCTFNLLTILITRRSAPCTGKPQNLLRMFMAYSCHFIFEFVQSAFFQFEFSGCHLNLIVHSLHVVLEVQLLGCPGSWGWLRDGELIFFGDECGSRLLVRQYAGKV